MNVPHFIGSMKQNNAIIVKTARTGVYVSVNVSCRINEACHRCSLCKSEEKKLTIFCPVPNPNELSKDDCVQIRYFSFNEVFASCFVFGIPIACSLAAYTAMTAILKTDNESDDAVLASTVALAAGFMIIYIFERLIKFFYPVTIETVLKKNEQ